MTSRTGLAARLIGAVLLLCFATTAQAERRVALVIGNSAYQTVPRLPNPADDAKLMADTLLSLGFFVVGGSAQTDLDKPGFDRALLAFEKELIGADVALFYFAGHGVETHGLNYIVPVDAHPADEGDVIAQSIGLASVLGRMEKSGAKINLMLLDACRNNPFTGHGIRTGTGGLAQMQAPPGTLISFATQPRSVALDGDDGHSPYTRALADIMRHQGYGLFRTFNEVGLAVEKATRGQQLPWVASSPISSSFYFAGRIIPSATVPISSDSPARPSDAALRRDLVTDCDRLAAQPYDAGHAPELPGVELANIHVAAATAACNEAMKTYPEVARFVFEAGRIANARKDYAEARRLFDKADAAGYPLAPHNIGTLYEGGDGVQMNNAEAGRWYRKSVALGEPIAMIDLAWLYQEGEGVAKNCAEAVRLNEAAIAAGVPAAMNNLGLLYLKGKCVGRDYAEARRLFEKGAALNDPPSINSLGTMYSAGRGMQRDARHARDLFRRAAALGNPEARQNLHGM